MLGLNELRLKRQQRGKAVVVPIRPKRTKRSKKPEDPGNMLERLLELRFELRCIEEAILAMERLAISRLPKAEHRLPRWTALARAEDRPRYEDRIAVAARQVGGDKVLGRPEVAATS
jgi:hypothetical protein